MEKYNKRTEEMDDEEPIILRGSGSPHDYSIKKKTKRQRYSHLSDIW
jgi:hypothetical protein